ncbi:MAG: RNA polymerase sigma factor [Roseburia sp.]|nr:RNA polymerase sigma factor [Roseburia sp.]
MKKLVKRAQRGDADAFVQLMEENRQSMYKTAICYVKNPEDAADVIQDTILTAFEKIGDLREAAYFRTWLMRILINKCKDFLDERSWEMAFENVPEREDGGENNSNPMLEHMIYEELLQSVEEKYRDILVLYYVEGFATKDIAEVLGMKDATVRTRLRRGREKLVRAYERQAERKGRRVDCDSMGKPILMKG